MEQLNLQLYGRTAGSGFTEELSTARTLTLTPEPMTVEMALNAPAEGQLIELRLDPNDAVSRFELFELKVKAADGTALYIWDGKAASLGELTDMRASRSHERVVIECLSSDPFMLLPMSRPTASVLMEISLGSSVANLASEELAESVRALQTTLRLAIDDLAAEQEGLQDALLLERARGRVDGQRLEQQLRDVLGRTDRISSKAADLDTRLGMLDAALNDTARQTRDVVLSEVRDDWRSLRRQLSDSFETASRLDRERGDALLTSLQIECAKLLQSMNRAARAEATLGDIRHELTVRSDADALAKIRELKDRLANAEVKIRSIEDSFGWRLLHPFRRPPRGHDA